MLTNEDIVYIGTKAFGVDPNLIRAVIKVESNWDPNAYRYEAHLGEASYGLMQVLPSTAKSVTGWTGLTIANLKTPIINVLVGTRYLKDLLNRYSLDKAISAYNAGRPITGNKPYVQSVKKWYRRYSFKF